MKTELRTKIEKAENALGRLLDYVNDNPIVSELDYGEKELLTSIYNMLIRIKNRTIK